MTHHTPKPYDLELPTRAIDWLCETMPRLNRDEVIAKLSECMGFNVLEVPDLETLAKEWEKK